MTEVKNQKPSFEAWYEYTHFFILMSGGSTTGIDREYFLDLYRKLYDPMSAARQFMWDKYGYHPQKRKERNL